MYDSKTEYSRALISRLIYLIATASLSPLSSFEIQGVHCLYLITISKKCKHRV